MKRLSFTRGVVAAAEEVNLSNGAVDGFTVRGGTITIGSQGFDASLTDYTGILARAVSVQEAHIRVKADRL